MLWDSFLMKILLKKEIYRFHKQYMRFTGKAINHRNVLKKRKKRKEKRQKQMLISSIQTGTKKRWWLWLKTLFTIEIRNENGESCFGVLLCEKGNRIKKRILFIFCFKNKEKEIWKWIIMDLIFNRFKDKKFSILFYGFEM